MKNYDGMNLEQLKAALEVSVETYNGTSDAMIKASEGLEQKAIIDAYNELSLLTEYTHFIKCELPIVELCKAYYFTIIGVKDIKTSEVLEETGHKIEISSRIIEMREKKHNLVDFIEWNQARNRQVTVTKTWRSAIDNARLSVSDEWDAFFASKDGYKMSVTKVKNALQAMVDELVFIKGEKSDKNAIVMSGKIAKYVIAFCTSRKDSRDAKKTIALEGSIMAKNTWRTLLLDCMHMAVEKKDYTLVYGKEDSPEDEQPEAEKEDAAK